MEPHDALTALINLFDFHHFNDFFSMNMIGRNICCWGKSHFFGNPGINQRLRVFDSLLESMLPALSARFKAMEIDSRMFLIEWFITGSLSAIFRCRFWHRTISFHFGTSIGRRYPCFRLLSPRGRAVSVQDSSRGDEGSSPGVAPRINRLLPCHSDTPWKAWSEICRRISRNWYRKFAEISEKDLFAAIDSMNVSVDAIRAM